MVGSTWRWGLCLAVAFTGCATEPTTQHIQIDAAATYACVLRDGSPLCWEMALQGEVASQPAVPTIVAGIEEAIALHVDRAGGCATRADGTAACWSRADHIADELGLTGVVDAAGAPDPTWEFDSSCALLDDGTVVCRGDNTVGQLGDGAFDSRNDFQPVLGINDAVQLDVGESAGWCATHASGEVSCWGAGTLGTGDWNLPDNPNATVVPGVADVAETHLGTNSHCARRHTGGVMCWGWQFSGQLGDGLDCEGANSDCIDPVPRDVAGTDNATVLGTAYLASCVLTDGKPLCWGWPVAGPDAVPPTAVTLPEPIVDVAGGFYFMCFAGNSGSVYCGKNGENPQLLDL